MFFLFGWGHQTKKSYGFLNDVYCGTCCENKDIEIIKVTTWFTLFFIPVIPTNTKYLMVCHKCGSIRMIDKKEFNDYISGNDKVTFSFNNNSNDKKEETINTRMQTEVQRNYWEELRKFEEEKNKQSNCEE